MKCKRCGKNFDPAYDFVEDTEKLEALNYYVEIENYCPNCLYEIDNNIWNFVSLMLKNGEN